jgi:hypothetical protein
MFTRKQLKRLARGLAKAKDHPEQMRRYLLLCRRERLIRDAYKQAVEATRQSNPLTEIGFAAPLSVHGEASYVVVRAENMTHRGLPVAFDLDEAGKHRGTPFDEVRRKLAEAGAPRDDAEILKLYELYLKPVPAPKFQKAPAALARVTAERRRIEGLIISLLDHPKYNTRRFMVVVERDELAEVLARVQPAADRVLIVSFAGPGKELVVDGNRVPVMTGERAGAQTVWMADLCGMLEMGGSAICMDCHSLHWVGWVSGKDDAGLVKRVGPMRYGYPGLKQERDDDGNDETED